MVTDIMKGKNLKNSLKTRGVRGLKQVGTTILRGKGINFVFILNKQIRKI